MSEAPSSVSGLVGGEWREAAASFVRLDPSDPARRVGEFGVGDEALVGDAVSAAQAASPDWAGKPISARAAVLDRFAEEMRSRREELARLAAGEIGKPIRDSLGEVDRSAKILRYFAGAADRPRGELYEGIAGGQIRTLRRPAGVAALITPWNFPFAIPVWKLAPALVYGNSVVLKPASDAVGCAIALARCAEAAGVPPGVFNLVIGSGARLGAALIESGGVDRVSFTGSEAAGSVLRAETAARGIPVQMELGGHGRLLVCADADLDAAADAAIEGAFGCSGQKCTATRRIFAHADVYESLLRKLRERLEGIRVGNASDPGVRMGPLVNERQRDDVAAAIERARSAGGSIHQGDPGPEAGWFLPPTLIEDLDDDAELSREEVFGPVVGMTAWQDLGEAFDRVNDTRYGLSGAVFTGSRGVAERCAEELRVGVLNVNGATTGADPHVPFGGVKASGWGPREQGSAAERFYTEETTVYG